jgi:CopG family nickel-responsive transcriptional regulator
LFRDLARAEVGRAQIKDNVPAVASLTIVYDHHVRDLSERLNELQHELGDRVRATLHIHLNHDLCLEVIVLRGQSDELRAISEKILATRGVKHGGVEVISESDHGRSHSEGHASGADFPAKKAHPARLRSKKKHKH